MKIFKKQPKFGMEKLQQEIDNDRRTARPDGVVPVTELTEERQQTYESVALSIGFEPAELISERLNKFFHDQDIKLYRYDEVVQYLTAERIRLGHKIWVWRPLRQKDEIEGFVFGGGEHHDKDGYYSKSWACRPYDSLVPFDILKICNKIDTQFGDRVKFFVSAFDKPGDPFIMVRPSRPGGQFFIFGVWDEPGFGI